MPSSLPPHAVTRRRSYSSSMRRCGRRWDIPNTETPVRGFHGSTGGLGQEPSYSHATILSSGKIRRRHPAVIKSTDSPDAFPQLTDANQRELLATSLLRCRTILLSCYSLVKCWFAGGRPRGASTGGEPSRSSSSTQNRRISRRAGDESSVALLQDSAETPILSEVTANHTSARTRSTTHGSVCEYGTS